MYTYTYTIEELIELANKVKSELVNASGLTELDNYVVLIGEPSWFGRLMTKIRSQPEKNVSHIMVVKHTDKDITRGAAE